MSVHEPTMTTECRTCHHIFGRWRPRCPACGTPYTPPAAFNPVAIERRERKEARRVDPVARAAKREPKNACIACHRRGGKVTCPHCGERAHPSCLALHGPDCAAFQVTLAAAHATAANPGGAS